MEKQLSASNQVSREEMHRIVEQHMGVMSRLLASEAGYRGLYGGLTPSDIRTRKKLPPGEEITDWMSPEELASNLFRASQAEARLRRELVQSQEDVEQVHFQVGQLVRRALAEIGSTMPEDLPPPVKSARQTLREELLWLSKSHELDPSGATEDEGEELSGSDGE